MVAWSPIKCASGLLLLLVLSTGAIAQKMARTNQPTDPIRPTRVVLKFAPLPLIDIDPAWQAGLELRVLRPLSVQQEIGYGPANWKGPFPDLNIVTPDYLRDGWQHQASWRYRSEIRYYVPLQFLPSFFKPNRRLSGVYIAAEYLYKVIGITKTTTAASGGIITALDYNQKINRTTEAGHLKLGFQTPLSRERKSFLSRVFVDFYVGGGRRYITIKQTEGPSVISANGRIPEALRYTRFIPNLQGWVPSASSGIKIGLAF